jgi:chromosome segregation ATPase
VQQAADSMWELAARASRLEGELASHSRKLEAIERRGRALRAEIGRKVEELAGEESRALRDATCERERGAKLREERSEHERARDSLDANINAMMRAARLDDAARRALEEVGATRARIDTLAQVERDYLTRATERETYGAQLRKQIDDLRAQLQRYSEALENDLQAGRDRIATRVREALGYEKAFAESCELLVNHLRGRPECGEVLDELGPDVTGVPRPSSEPKLAPAK